MSNSSTTLKPNYTLVVKHDVDYSKTLFGKSEIENISYTLFGRRDTTYSRTTQIYSPPIITVMAIPDRADILEFEPVEITVGYVGDSPPELVEPTIKVHKFHTEAIVIKGKELYSKVDISKSYGGLGFSTNIRGYRYENNLYEIERRVKKAIEKLEYKLDVILYKEEMSDGKATG